MFKVNGLMIVKGKIIVLCENISVDVVGGLYAAGGICEQATDSSGNFSNATLCNGPLWQPSGGQTNGALEFDCDKEKWDRLFKKAIAGRGPMPSNEMPKSAVYPLWPYTKHPLFRLRGATDRSRTF